MYSTAEIPHLQIDKRRLLVRVSSLHEDSDRICSEGKRKCCVNQRAIPALSTSNLLDSGKHRQKYTHRINFEPHAIYTERQKKQSKTKEKK